MSNITQKWVNVLLPFTLGYSKKCTETELATLSGIPQQSASRYLQSIVRQNLLNYIIQGRNKLFYLDMSKESTFIMLQILEHHKALEFQNKVKEVSLIINELLSYSESLILFGSYASYTFDKESDIDIAIIGKYNKRKIKTIKQKYPLQINEHYLSYDELARSLESKNSLAMEILKNHILFGNVSKIVSLMMRTSL